MTREDAIVMQKAMRDNLHETGKDYPYRDDMIPLMKESCDIAIKALEQQKPMENFESVKDHILKLASDYKCWDNRLTHDEALELCHILEQKPCEDAISRSSVFEIMGNLMSIPYDFDRPINEKDVSESMDEIRALPSVTLTRNKGHWKRTTDAIGHFVWECDICEWQQRFATNYCPDCGAEMESEE